MKQKLLFVKMLCALGFMIFSLQAQATISITPSDCGTTFDCWTTDQTSTLTTSEVESLIGYSGTLDELYKMDVGASSDTGPYAGSYQTTFSNTSTDPQDALIQYISGTAINCPDCYLLIKDGNNSPAQYIFDIGSWNGTDDLSMTGFWPNQGAISHVSIYGSPKTNKVPEPSALAILALGLLMLGTVTVSRRNKA